MGLFKKDFNSGKEQFSRTSDSIGAIIVSVMFILVGVIMLFDTLIVGIMLLSFGISIIILQVQKMALFGRLSELNEELISDLSDKEKVKAIFAPITSNNSKIKSGSDNYDATLSENSMILTGKRVIILNFAPQNLGDFQVSNFWKTIKDSLNLRRELAKKIKEELDNYGIVEMVENSRIAYSFNYSEISKIEIKPGRTNKIIFYYRKNKYSYFVDKRDVDKLKETFRHYIKA
jgi:hypothetical protein